MPKPLNDSERFATITSSIIGKITGNGWGTLHEAVLSIFQMDRDKEGKLPPEIMERLRLGKENEDPIAKWYMAKRSEDEKIEIKLEEPDFRRHPDLPFLGVTADRVVYVRTSKNEWKADNTGAEIKYRAGVRQNMRVNLQRYRGDKRYADQCYLQMMIFDWDRVDLVVASDVNAEYYTYRDYLSWWRTVAQKKVIEFYNTYLRWFWENDLSNERTAPLRQLLHDAGKSNDEIEALFKRKPLQNAHVQLLRSRRGVSK